MNVSLGEKIRIYRKRAGITQYELAEAVGISKSAVSNYELGYTEPRLKVMLAILMVLEIPISDIIDLVY